MKKKLTLSVDERLIKVAKKKAVDHDCSVSELFEYFIRATQKDRSIIENLMPSNKKENK